MGNRKKHLIFNPRQSFKYKSLIRSTTFKSSKLVELQTWGVNTSTSVEDYIDLNSVDSFIWQPDSTRFGYNETTAFCGPSVKIIIFVTSAPTNFEQRRAIRETWGSTQNLFSKGVRLVFVLGNSDSTSTEVMLKLHCKYFMKYI